MIAVAVLALACLALAGLELACLALADFPFEDFRVQGRTPMQSGYVPDTLADVSALRHNKNNTPNTTNEDGVARFVKWYRDYHGR